MATIKDNTSALTTMYLTILKRRGGWVSPPFAPAGPDWQCRRLG